MTSLLNRRSAFSLARWALGMRILSALLVDGAALGNAGWISLLLSALIACPVVLLLCLISKSNPAAKPMQLVDDAIGVGFRRVLCAIMCAFTLFEVGNSVRMGVLSAQYVAFEQTPFYLLDLGAILICALACFCGGRGIAGAARLFRGFLYMFVLILVIAQRTSFNWRWLMPILGPGWQPLLRSSLSLAGMWMGIISLWLCTSEETGNDRTGGADYPTTGPFYMMRLLGVVLLAIFVMICISYLITPVLPFAPNERDLALDKLLSNGLNAISLQFLLMMIWYMAESLQMSYYVFIASLLLQAAFPSWKGWICVVTASALGYALTLSKISDRSMIDPVNALVRLPAGFAIALFIAIMHFVKQRRNRVAKA